MSRPHTQNMGIGFHCCWFPNMATLRIRDINHKPWSSETGRHFGVSLEVELL